MRFLLKFLTISRERLPIWTSKIYKKPLITPSLKAINKRLIISPLDLGRTKTKKAILFALFVYSHKEKYMMTRFGRIYVKRCLAVTSFFLDLTNWSK